MILLDHPEWLEGFVDEQLTNLLASAELADFLATAVEYTRGKEREAVNIAALTTRARPEMAQVVADAADRIGRDYDDEKVTQIYTDTLRELKYLWADRSIKALEAEYANLDFARDRERYAQIMEQIKQLNGFRAAHSS